MSNRLQVCLALTIFVLGSWTSSGVHAWCSPAHEREQYDTERCRLRHLAAEGRVRGGHMDDSEHRAWVVERSSLRETCDRTQLKGSPAVESNQTNDREEIVKRINSRLTGGPRSARQAVECEQEEIDTRVDKVRYVIRNLKNDLRKSQLEMKLMKIKIKNICRAQALQNDQEGQFAGQTNTRVEDIERKMNRTSKRISKVRLDLVDAEIKMQELENNWNALSDELKNLTLQIQQLDAIIHDVDTHTKEDSEKLTSLKQEMEQFVSRTDQMDATIHDVDAYTKEDSQKLTSLQKEVEKLVGRMEQMDAIIHNVDTHTKEESQKLTSLQQEVEKLVGRMEVMDKILILQVESQVKDLLKEAAPEFDRLNFLNRESKDCIIRLRQLEDEVRGLQGPRVQAVTGQEPEPTRCLPVCKAATQVSHLHFPVLRNWSLGHWGPFPGLIGAGVAATRRIFFPLQVFLLSHGTLWLHLRNAFPYRMALLEIVIVFTLFLIVNSMMEVFQVAYRAAMTCRVVGPMPYECQNKVFDVPVLAGLRAIAIWMNPCHSAGLCKLQCNTVRVWGQVRHFAIKAATFAGDSWRKGYHTVRHAAIEAATFVRDMLHGFKSLDS